MPHLPKHEANPLSSWKVICSLWPPPTTVNYQLSTVNCFVKSYFLHKDFAIGKIHHLQKSGENVESGRTVLWKPKMDIHNPHPLWKTPVDKTVENVENSELSTEIRAVFKIFTTCGKDCISSCINSPSIRREARYVTGANDRISHKSKGKSLQNVKNWRHNLLQLIS